MTSFGCNNSKISCTTCKITFWKSLSGELLPVRRASAHRWPWAQSYLGQWVLPSLVGKRPIVAFKGPSRVMSRSPLAQWWRPLIWWWPRLHKWLIGPLWIGDDPLCRREDPRYFGILWGSLDLIGALFGVVAQSWPDVAKPWADGGSLWP